MEFVRKVFASHPLLAKYCRYALFAVHRDTDQNFNAHSTASAQFLDHPLTRPIVPLLPPSVQSLANNETVKATMDDYDSARVFLAKWAAGLADQSEKSEPFDQRYRHVGIWGHDDWEEETALGVFEVLNVSFKVELVLF